MTMNSIHVCCWWCADCGCGESDVLELWSWRKVQKYGNVVKKKKRKVQRA